MAYRLKFTSIKAGEENSGENTCDFGLGNGFLDKTPKAQMIKKTEQQKHR